MLNCAILICTKSRNTIFYNTALYYTALHHTKLHYTVGGGLAEWYPTYLLRYSGASLDQAGLLVGVATVLGGIGGNVLGV